MIARRIALVFLFACVACGTGRGPRTPDDARTTISSDTTVFDRPTTAVLIVESRHPLDITISVLTADGVQHRLGRVGTSRTVRLNIARYLSIGGSLRFVAEPLGARTNFSTRAISPAVQLKSGNEARWTIESDVTRSHLEVR